jgi:hypothetical protein
LIRPALHVLEIPQSLYQVRHILRRVRYGRGPPGVPFLIDSLYQHVRIPRDRRNPVVEFVPQERFLFASHSVDVVEALAAECGLEQVDAEVCSDPYQQLCRVEWFCDVVDCAELEPFDEIVGLNLCCKKNHGDAGSRRGRLKYSADLEPIHLGHHDVQKDEIRDNLCRDIQSLLLVLGHVYLVALPLQDIPTLFVFSIDSRLQPVFPVAEVSTIMILCCPV